MKYKLNAVSWKWVSFPWKLLWRRSFFLLCNHCRQVVVHKITERIDLVVFFHQPQKIKVGIQKLDSFKDIILTVGKFASIHTDNSQIFVNQDFVLTVAVLTVIILENQELTEIFYKNIFLNFSFFSSLFVNFLDTLNMFLISNCSLKFSFLVSLI